MGRSFDAVPDHLAEWMVAQPVWFVATAPLAGDGHVNVSPKGDDAFRVISPIEVAYVDLTGSGAESIAHLRENGRLTIMFCSFGDKPNIVRVFGRGRSVLPGDERFAELAGRFPARDGARGIIVLDVEQVTSSCGYAVPHMELVGARDTLAEWAGRKSGGELAAYRAEKRRRSTRCFSHFPARDLDDPCHPRAPPR